MTRRKKLAAFTFGLLSACALPLAPASLAPVFLAPVFSEAVAHAEGAGETRLQTRQARRQAERQAQRQAERQAARQAERQAERKAARQAERQAERRAARQAERREAKDAGFREVDALRSPHRPARGDPGGDAPAPEARVRVEPKREAGDRDGKGGRRTGREERDRDRGRDHDRNRDRDWGRDRDRDWGRDHDGDRRWRGPRHGYDRYKVVDRRPHGWRPHYHRPPRWRAPHPYWGGYHYSPFWGWYFTAPLAYSTLVYIDERPSGPTCEDVYAGDDRLIACDGALYRPVKYRERTVYEIVSADPEQDAGYGAETGAEFAAPPARTLRLASPLMRGEDVAALQRELRALGYLRSAPDGVFGAQTAGAVRAFQRDQGLPADGVVAGETAFLLGV